jgi:hypothetical protein
MYTHKHKGFGASENPVRVYATQKVLQENEQPLKVFVPLINL